MFGLNKNNFSSVSCRVGKWVALELHFNIDFIHLTAAEGYVEVLYCPSLCLSFLDILCFRISHFPSSWWFESFDRKGKSASKCSCPCEGYGKLCSGEEMLTTCRRASFWLHGKWLAPHSMSSHQSWTVGWSRCSVWTTNYWASGRNHWMKFCGLH